MPNDPNDELHRFVDRLEEGISAADADKWVRDVLTKIGTILRLAADAFDYEAGRVLSGTERAPGSFPVSTPFPEWTGSELSVDEATAKQWVAAGRAARSATLKPEQLRNILCAQFGPIAHMSYGSQFSRLIDALDALNFGEQHEIVKPSPVGLGAQGRGRYAWSLRLKALACIEFQVAANLSSKSDAIKAVADACGRDVRTIRDWQKDISRYLAGARTAETISIAQNAGGQYRQLREISDGGQELDPAQHKLLNHFEATYGKAQLAIIGSEYRGLPRKKSRLARKKP